MLIVKIAKMSPVQRDAEYKRLSAMLKRVRDHGDKR